MMIINDLDAKHVCVRWFLASCLQDEANAGFLVLGPICLMKTAQYVVQNLQLAGPEWLRPNM